jgi:hypothetical protein
VTQKARRRFLVAIKDSSALAAMLMRLIVNGFNWCVVAAESGGVEVEKSLMSVLALAETGMQHNPLDIVEEIVAANEWLFERNTSEELVVELSGRWCHYRLFFVWQPLISALQFSCQFDMKVPDGRLPAVHELLAVMNGKLWLGHFEMCTEDNSPLFRHTLLLRGVRGGAVETLEDLVEIALTESERFYPAFQLVIWGGKRAEDALGAAMIETIGQA